MINIYVLIDPRNEEIRYVGKTRRSLPQRLKGHVYSTKTTQDCTKVRWIRALMRQGYRPRIELVQRVHDTHWEEAERFWINHFRERGCQLTNTR